VYSLEQLRGFVAVAEELHFGRAAERLNMTQPPLSRQIQKLERAIEVNLFERNNRRVVLTAAGEAFLGEARKLLALADSAPDLARRISAGSTGIVRIGFTAASAFGLLGALLNEVSGKVPGIELDLHEMVTDEQIAALKKGEIDLGLARPQFDEELFASKLLYRESMMVAVPAGHPLGRRDRPVDPAELRHERLIMHSPTRARYFYDLAVRLVAFPPESVVHTVSQILTMVSLVAAGRGLALVPRSAMSLNIAGVEYTELDSVNPDPVELHALWVRESRNPALWRFLDALTLSPS
jgi:DNA-binding transcriptional LysR family regulator